MSIRKNGYAVAIIIFSALSAAGDAQAAAPRGENLVQSWCSQCHSVKPDQTSPNPAAPRFPDVAAEPSMTEYALRAFLKTPHPTMPNIMMNADDIDDIVSYILSLRPRR